MSPEDKDNLINDYRNKKLFSLFQIVDQDNISVYKGKSGILDFKIGVAELPSDQKNENEIAHIEIIPLPPSEDDIPTNEKSSGALSLFIQSSSLLLSAGLFLY